jgi:hypothetical protein
MELAASGIVIARPRFCLEGAVQNYFNVKIRIARMPIHIYGIGYKFHPGSLLPGKMLPRR